MKLHAFHGERFMPHAHDFAVVRPGRYFERVGQRGAFKCQRMIARTSQRIGQAKKYAFIQMLYGGNLSVHQLLR